MNTMKILFIEDAADQQGIFQSSVEVFNAENDLNIEYEIAKDVSEALNKIDGAYDGAIIDLKLGNDQEGGNKIVDQLGDSFTRIPIIFVTGFVDLVNNHPSIIKIRSRDEEAYGSDFRLFEAICNTGLTRIMGGRGIIEESLSKVFLENLLPQIETWVSYGKEYLEEDPERTEKALLRYALNHLFQLLEEDDESCFPEEVYLYPHVSKKITTGSIVREDNQWYVVLSPACDLVIRGNNQFKTDRILFVEVEEENDIVDKALTDIRGMSEGRKKREKMEEKLKEISRNNYTFYYHWLPKANCFPSGFLNFRKLETLNKNDFDEKIEQPLIQISPFFVKDIVSRFSSYYARQGQPDIDNKVFVDSHTQQQS